jgi:hypothetical protein
MQRPHTIRWHGILIRILKHHFFIPDAKESIDYHESNTSRISYSDNDSTGPLTKPAAPAHTNPDANLMVLKRPVQYPSVSCHD